jgi:translation initiation factor eIF-2B subunit epsilon
MGTTLLVGVVAEFCSIIVVSYTLISRVIIESHNEIVLTLERAFEENHTVENVVLELNTLKFAANLDFHDLRLKTIPTMLNLVKGKVTVKDVFNRWGEALAKFVIEYDDQLDALKVLEVRVALCY